MTRSHVRHRGRIPRALYACLVRNCTRLFDVRGWRGAPRTRGIVCEGTVCAVSATCFAQLPTNYSCDVCAAHDRSRIRGRGEARIITNYECCQKLAYVRFFIRSCVGRNSLQIWLHDRAREQARYLHEWLVVCAARTSCSRLSVDVCTESCEVLLI